jgi:uncharacterized membrane protein YhaH (DUF805 family)
VLPAYHGRINRKTFILGNAVGLGLLGFAALIYIVPLAIADIVINGSNGSIIFKFLYGLFVIPAIFYFFYFTVLFVKRVHDVGYPGMLILWLFIGAQVAARLLDQPIFTLAGIVLIVGLCALPGQKAQNHFGPKPHKKFRLDDLVVTFK